MTNPADQDTNRVLLKSTAHVTSVMTRASAGLGCTALPREGENAQKKGARMTQFHSGVIRADPGRTNDELALVKTHSGMAPEWVFFTRANSGQTGRGGGRGRKKTGAPIGAPVKHRAAARLQLALASICAVAK